MQQIASSRNQTLGRCGEDTASVHRTHAVLTKRLGSPPGLEELPKYEIISLEFWLGDV